MAIPHKRSKPLWAQIGDLENGAHEEAGRNLLKPLAGRSCAPAGINGGHMTKLRFASVTCRAVARTSKS
jgi:hypothetical protein